MRIHELGASKLQQTAPKRAGKGFSGELARAQKAQLRFSAHAQDRLRERKIQLSPAQFEALAGAVEQASAKGAKETLCLLDQLAFVVSVKNRTVITAASQSDLKDKIFTNIDSAIICGVDRKEPF